MVPWHPVLIYEALSYLVIFLLRFAYYRKCRSQMPDGYLFGRSFILVFGSRFLLEFFKAYQASFASGWPLTPPGGSASRPSSPGSSW